ncbi:MAG: FHA domain-containing protein [Bdellovibrionaceae bacterium]|nr:FHA domain-containing protein [Pseudobdellovibrionaceae bacterium]
MWAFRVLTGPQAGRIFPLKSGKNLLGRGPQCDIQITSGGVSKEHCEIHVYPEKILVVDLNSSNGTFVNGVRVQNGMVRLGEKISVHDVIGDIIPAPAQTHPNPRPQAQLAQVLPQSAQVQVRPPNLPPHHAMGYPPSPPNPFPPPPPAGNSAGASAPPLTIWDKINYQINEVALPGVYRLAEITDFRNVIIGLMIIFMFSVVFLAMIPMNVITREAIELEAKRRAESLARTLQSTNQRAVHSNSMSSLSTHLIETEDGVRQALIIQQNDGMILAPASRAGTTPDLPFVHKARREGRPIVEMIDSNTVGASVPIAKPDPATGEPIVSAQAVVIYDIKSLSYDQGRILSLFFQTLVIAAAVGLVVFFFLYKLIEHPIVTLNEQLNKALRERKDEVVTTFQFPALQVLAGNISSLLTRLIHGESGGTQTAAASREVEAGNLVAMVGVPAVTIEETERIIGANPGFLQLARAELGALQSGGLSAIQDSALQANIRHLMGRAKESPNMIHNDNLEFSGHPCVINCQAIMSDKSQPVYFLISIIPVEGG